MVDDLARLYLSALQTAEYGFQHAKETRLKDVTQPPSGPGLTENLITPKSVENIDGFVPGSIDTIRLSLFNDARQLGLPHLTPEDKEKWSPEYLGRLSI